MIEVPDNFLGLEPEFSDPETASAVILPVPYEGGVSWGKGAARGPASIIRASQCIEFYDEVFGIEPHRRGVHTAPALDVSGTQEQVRGRVYAAAREWLGKGKFLVTLGGDHSVTAGAFRAAFETNPGLACVHLDAHADLRDAYEGSRLSHACVMSRVRELTRDTLSIGVRSLDAQQMKRVLDEGIKVVFMHLFRRQDFSLERTLSEIGDAVYLTVDVDAFDWGVIRSTGTPEPGGFTWDEGMRVFEKIFLHKNVVACDVVELSAGDDDPNSAAAAAKIAFKMLAMKFGIERIGRITDLV